MTGKIANGGKKYGPDDINPLIAFVMSLLDEGFNSILYLMNKDINSSFDSEGIEEYIDQIAAIINFYWYDDGIDNDGDGSIDEETINGIDDDNDGLVDEDTDYHPSDPTSQENTQFFHVWQMWNNR